MRWRALLDRYGDALIAVLLAAGWALELTTYPDAGRLAALAGAGCALTVAGRRRLPLASFAVMIALFEASQDLAPSYTHNGLFPLAVFLFSLYSLGRHTHGLEARLSVIGVLLGVVGAAAGDGDFRPGGLFFYCMLCFVPWGGGLAVRLRIEHVQVLEARNASLRDEAERAVADERARIARELHDVVSHAIAVTVLQARGGAKLVGRDDGAVRGALRAIEETNTAALADMRRLLRSERTTEEHGGAGGPAGGGPRDEPAPTLGRLDRLVEGVRASGLPVDLAVRGAPVPVPPGLDLSAYRIVQEALTNVLKHAGPQARARVEVGYEGDGLTVAVVNTGTRPAAVGDAGGHGLVGIRERVAVAGGTVEAGPSEEGYAVRARLPYLTGAG